MERDSDFDASPNAGRNRRGRRRRNPNDPRRAAPTSGTRKNPKVGSDSDSDSYPSKRKPPKNKDPKKPPPGKDGCNDKDPGGKNNDGSGKDPDSQGTPDQKTTGFWDTSNAYGAETRYNEASQGRGGAEGNQRSAASYENYYEQQSSYSAYRDTGFQGSAYDLQSTPDVPRQSTVESPPYSAIPRTPQPLSHDDFARYSTLSQDTTALPVNKGYYNHESGDDQSVNTKGWNVRGSHDR